MQLNGIALNLIAQPTYQQPSLDRAVDEVLSSLVFPGNLRTARILLKPNLITAGNGTLPCTEGRFIAAAARWFLVQGSQVAVGDSPSFGSARAVLRAIGALSTLQALGVPVVEFRQARETVLPCGQKAALADAALDCDLLINLPKVKAHSQMGVTLAVKNYFGCLSGFHKPWWHMVHGGDNGRFPALLVDLLSVLPAGISLVDGIVAMHTTGPIHGQPFPLGLIAGGVNPVAIDTALLAVLGVDPLQSPLWLAARQAGITGSSPEELEFTRMTPAALRVHGFVVPDELAPIRFNPFRFVRNAIRRLRLRAGGA